MSSADHVASDDANTLPKEVVESNDNTVVEDKTDQWELICWRLRLGHLSFRNIQMLAALGVLPKKLLRAKIPKFSAYLHRKMIKWLWSTKEETVKKFASCEETWRVCFGSHHGITHPTFHNSIEKKLTKRR